MTIKRITLSLVTAGLCAGGCVAVASGDDEAPRATPPAAIAADALPPFAVFQRPSASSDRMPPATRRMLDTIAKKNGVDLDRARAVAASAGRAVWAIPGQDKVCLAIPDPVDGFGVSCGDVETAKSGRLWVTLLGLPGQKLGDVRIAQFLPDGVDVVTAVSDAGQTRTIASSDNVAFADVTSGTIGFRDGAGEHRVRVDGTSEAMLAAAK